MRESAARILAYALGGDGLAITGSGALVDVLESSYM